MKKISTILCFVLLTAIAANAQEYRKFRVGLGGGYAVASGTGAKGGILFYLEPGYRVNDQILVGVRFEGSIILRGFASDDVTTGSASASAAGAQGIFGQYYLGSSSFRPFVGVGIGMNKIATAAADLNGEAFAGVDESKFGFFPRIGFDISHFTLSLDFNIIGGSTLTGTSGTELKTKNGYVGVRFGGFFGGGKK